jgi:TRAP-type C4-dicarboxylate transport system substrate-binding protein
MTARSSFLLAVCLGTCFAGGTAGAVDWDQSIVWPATNFQTKNAIAFAEDVKKATNGEVNIIVHSGGSLGIKGPESMRAVRDGLVPIAEFHMAIQAGNVPALGLAEVPFLVNGYKDLRVLYDLIRPEWEKSAQRLKQRICYMVPWPSQNLFTKIPINTIADLKNLKIRTDEKTITTFYAELGANPVAMPWGDVVPSLASGVLDGVTTSSSSGVDGSFWEFLRNVYRLNQKQATDMVTISEAALSKLKPEHREAIMKLCREAEDKFWGISQEEDAAKLAVLKSKGMEVLDPSPELSAELIKRAIPLWDNMLKPMGPGAQQAVAEFRKRTGK